MNSYPQFELSRLRDIGWKEWDPIRLLPVGEKWELHPEFADEYDRYLLQASSELRGTWSISDAVEYLIFIESEHMGLGRADRMRAEATAKALKAYVDGRSSD